MRRILCGVATAALLSLPAAAQERALQAMVPMKGADGADLGTIALTQTNAGVLVTAELTGLPPGVHGFHFHETGTCEPPFESAGGHFNPTGAQHGFLADGGPHAGDMPNVQVAESGALNVEVLNTMVSIEQGAPESLFDDDGSALVIHAGADDYSSPPSGHAGDRLACGVVSPP